tara:strand:- start:119 stop:1231 length:1113 start_codon:yes stop_codon:yes gene_type:complete
MALIKSIDNVGVGQWPIAKTLGLTSKQVIKKILIPNIIPWYFASAMIIIMEVLSDFGGVSAFNYDTLSTAIYTAWTGLFSYNLAVKISMILILISILLFGIEGKIKKGKKFTTNNTRRYMSHPPIHLSNSQQFFLHIPILIYFLLSLALPSFLLLKWSTNLNQKIIIDVLNLLKDTVILGFVLALLTTGISFIYSYLSKRKLQLIKSIELMGYSLPGTIVAVCFIGIISIINNYTNFKVSIANIIFLSLALIYRHLFVGERNWSSSFTKINSATENTAKVLGLGLIQRFKLTYLPIWKENYLPITTLLFIEIIKELPITLMLRPFGLNTLSIKIYELTTEGYWEEAGIYSLALMILGLPLSYYAFNRRKS